jgi:phenylacetate-coenzyme A ligase PaaK-like adenylate-forming protein
MSVVHPIFARQALLGSSSLDRGALDRFRDRCIRRLVRHAYDEVPYYRKLFDQHGIDPTSVRGTADLGRIPWTSKRNLQACAASELVARGSDPDSLIVRRTTGSTGQPLSIRRTWLEERLLGAFRWRALRSMGSRLTDRYAEIEEITPRDPNDRARIHAVLQRIGMLRQARIDALREPEEIFARLQAFGPDVISGYAGVISHLADVAREPDLRGLRPRFVVVHSDTLTARMRAAIAGAFRSPVYEIYDCNEVNVVAWECVATGALHVSDDTTVVEVISNGRLAEPGEQGEVVLTALHSFAMPLLRYRIGDLVIQGGRTCACGHPFSTIRAVQGRMFDYLRLADGRVVHPYEIIAILDRTASWLLRYRILQERRDHVTLTMVARSAPSLAEVARVREAVAAFLGPLVALRVETVEELEPGDGAKWRVCQSLVASEYDGPTDRRPYAQS